MTTEATQDDPYLFTLVLKPLLERAKEARDMVAAAFELWGLDSYVARLVVTEFFSNACRVSGPDSCIVVRTYRNGARPHVEVWDRSEEQPVVKRPGPDEEDGRGLLTVDMLCVRWGVRPLAEGGKVVWAELPRPRHDSQTERAG